MHYFIFTKESCHNFLFDKNTKCTPTYTAFDIEQTHNKLTMNKKLSITKVKFYLSTLKKGNPVKKKKKERIPQVVGAQIKIFFISYIPLLIIITNFTWGVSFSQSPRKTEVHIPNRIRKKSKGFCSPTPIEANGGAFLALRNDNSAKIHRLIKEETKT